jgi:hypothetical protein
MWTLAAMGPEAKGSVAAIVQRFADTDPEVRQPPDGHQRTGTSHPRVTLAPPLIHP